MLSGALKSAILGPVPLRTGLNPLERLERHIFDTPRKRKSQAIRAFILDILED